MIRRFLLAALLCLAFWPAIAQVPMTGAGHGAPGGSAPSYTGPGDVATYRDYWSVGACYDNAYASAGNAAFTLERASDSTTQIIDCLSTGLPNYAAAATFCASTTCIVTVLTDQAGSANLTPGTLLDSPSYIASALGSCAAIGVSTTYMGSAASVTQAQPFTFQGISLTTSGSSSDPIVGEFTSGGSWTVHLQYWAPNTALNAGTLANTGPVISTNSFFDIMGYFNGASSAARVDSGSEVTLSPGATGLTSSNKLGMYDFFGDSTEKYVQTGLMIGTQSSAARATLNTNIHSQCGGF